MDSLGVVEDAIFSQFSESQAKENMDGDVRAEQRLGCHRGVNSDRKSNRKLAIDLRIVIGSGIWCFLTSD